MATCRSMFAIVIAIIFSFVVVQAQQQDESVEQQMVTSSEDENADGGDNGRVVAQTAAANGIAEGEEGDAVEAALNHCPVMCSPHMNTNHPLRPLLPNYATYGACMDDCVCAAYCYILDSLGEWVYADCFRQCGKTQPFSGPDPNAFVRMIHSRNINI